MAANSATPESTLDEATPEPPSVGLTEAQIRFFTTFGFVHVPAMFTDDLDQISAGFDEVFANEAPEESRRDIHFGEPRLTIGPGFVERSDKLSWLKSTPRLTSSIAGLIGPGFEDNESDGNIFRCDTGWHSDMFGASLDRRYVKVYFYLDPLTHDTGALRVVPGTNSHTSDYARDLRGRFWNPDGPATAFGIEPQAVPSWTIETSPGDVIFGDFRTLHATFGNGRSRRLFTINFSASIDAGEPRTRD